MAKKRSSSNRVLHLISASSLALGLSIAPSQWDFLSGGFGIPAAAAADFLGAGIDASPQAGVPAAAGLDGHVDIGHGGLDRKLKSNDPAEGTADVHGGPSNHMDAGTDGNTDGAAAFGVAPNSGAKTGIYSEGITADRPDIDEGRGSAPRSRTGPSRKSTFDGAGEETD